MSLDIRSGFSGRTLFLTGCTGFVGKVALFKILKEFPDVDTIYVLMRGKRSRKFKKMLNAQERLDMEVLGSPCFDPLKAAIGDGPWGALKKKVRAVHGDITLDDLGISAEQQAVLFDKVNFVVHLAATVNFNERLDLAIQMNTLGGLRVLGLAKRMRHLEAMVHVSTCYVNYPRQGRELVNEERLYPLNCDPEKVVKSILGMNPREVERVGGSLLREHGFANTYTFTKNLGEQLLFKYKQDVPLVIVRPSIIGCSLLEPFPGWVDALTAAGGLMLTAALGVLREVTCDENCLGDVVPVDFVVNTILKALFQTQQHYARHHRRAAVTATAAAPASAAAAAALPAAIALPVGEKSSQVSNAMVPAAAATAEAAPAHEAEPLSSVPRTVPSSTDEDGFPLIYQACSTAGCFGPTWRRLVESLHDLCGPKRLSKGLAPSHVTLTKSPSYYELRYWALRYLPYKAFATVIALPMVGDAKQRQLAEKWGRAVRRAHSLNREFRVFIMTEWIFDNANSLGLDRGLNEYSCQAFPYDPLEINWYYYAQLYTYGIFQHIVKDTCNLKAPATPASPSALFAKVAKL